MPRQISYGLHEGDSRSEVVRLARQPAENGKYRLIVTSPPYFGHRHYGKHEGELGREKTDAEFIRNLADTFSACRELLTEDGSIWVVIGDTRRNMHKVMVPHKHSLLERWFVKSTTRSMIFKTRIPLLILPEVTV